MLSLHSTVREFIKFEVGNSKLIHLWLDNWHTFGSLHAKYGFIIIWNGNWCWKLARFDKLVDIHSILPNVPIGDVDKPIWTVSRKGVYVNADTWDYMRKRKQEVSWWSVVWFPQAIPKQAFILWLAILDHLTTRERLVTWGYQRDTQCV
jgi:hypothetical protein